MRSSPKFKRPDMIARNKANMMNFDGEHHDHITIIKRLDEKDKNGQYFFLCKCDCGKEFKLRGGSVHTQKSCGCMTGKILSDYRKTHGESKTKLYDVWHRMKDRCNRPNHKSYMNYGGRGIKVCPEWENDYETFAKWARENGYDENAEFMECTLERIDVNKGYEPSNCKFTNMKEQCNNRTNNHRLTYNGESHTIAEWSEITGIKFCTLWRRWKNGWSVERILESPLRLTEDETVEKVLLLFKENEYVTKELFEERIGNTKISKYVELLKERGYHIVSEWQYVGKPAGWCGRYKLYYLGEDK